MSESKIQEETRKNDVDFQLENGETVRLRLNFARLKILEKLNFELFERFNKINYGKSENIIDLATIVYVAYWCANYDGINKIYSEDEFVELVPFDVIEIQRVQNALMKPKKK